MVRENSEKTLHSPRWRLFIYVCDDWAMIWFSTLKQGDNLILPSAPRSPISPLAPTSPLYPVYQEMELHYRYSKVRL